VKSYSCDVLIVGGGPAGLASATALRQRGIDALVIEALKPPIDKTCGEGLMPDARRELESLGVVFGEQDGATFTGIHFANRNGVREDCVTAEFRGGAGLGVRRVHLHARLAARAEEAGVRVAWGAHVLMKDGDSKLTIDGEPCSYRYLIGADGQSSRVRRWAGLEQAALISRRFGFRKHFKIAPWSSHVEVHWGERGQAYVTPVGTNEICVSTMSRHGGLHMDDIVSGIPYLRERLGPAEATTRERGAVTTTRRLERVARGNVALLGDASGSADAITGEGLAMSFRQALLLADAIERDDLPHYAAMHQGILKMPQTMARTMLAMDRWSWFRDRAMRMLASDPALFGRMLAVHLGEESLNHFVLHRGLVVGLRMLAPATL
jgi:flavin-dependent dehydrogenase